MRMKIKSNWKSFTYPDIKPLSFLLTQPTNKLVSGTIWKYVSSCIIIIILLFYVWIRLVFTSKLVAYVWAFSHIWQLIKGFNLFF